MVIHIIKFHNNKYWYRKLLIFQWVITTQTLRINHLLAYIWKFKFKLIAKYAAVFGMALKSCFAYNCILGVRFETFRVHLILFALFMPSAVRQLRSFELWSADDYILIVRFGVLRLNRSNFSDNHSQLTNHLNNDYLKWRS